jgi:signal transduction histidine kinase
VNLLTNAMRYGKGKPVIVSTGLTEKTITISVKDFGSGIAPSDHQRIFERFERATATADKAGLGLGLFIVKIIVELHRGAIKVKSNVGQGAEFIVELPR